MPGSDTRAAVEALLREDAHGAGAAFAALEDPAARALVSDIARIAKESATIDDLARATTKERLSELGRRHGLKGTSLFRPLRLAVTGSEHGIELALLLPLLGPQRVASRIDAALSLAPPG